MAELVASVSSNTVGNLATEYASPYLSYFFRFGKIVEEFKNQRKALELKKDSVKNDVDAAIRQTEAIEKDVEDWLTRAENELGVTQILEDEIGHINCSKWCPNWGWRYCLSKKLAKKTLLISELLETCNFSPIGRRAPLQGIEFITSKDFRDSESSKSAFIGIMEAINANMIGLYGIPGVGKVVAKEVGKHALEQKLFDKVVMFTMSQNPNINKIQDKVADIFRLKFETSSQEGKAEELFRSMQGVNNILVIFDDVWEEFEPETIGIPFGVAHEGCKILLTTRHQQVCTIMNCQKKIQLGILSEVEAWTLFKDNAGVDDGPSSLNDVAKEVARECKGLPLALVTVAKALKGESLDGWRAANQRLKDSRHLDNEEVFGGVYSPLKLSYDYLKKNNSQTTENDIQSCFLLCSLFPEDDEILIEILIMCGIGVGLFSHICLIEDKRREIGVALTKLQKSGLLLETDNAETVRMHDVVRDFAHWLKSMGENRFMVQDELKEWPHMVENFGCYTGIALWNCSSHIDNFPDKAKLSKLKILVVSGKEILRVSSTFFEEMKSLHVLILIDVNFSLEGLQSLTNLRTLCCIDCKPENLSSLTHMRNLEILALFGTNTDEILEDLVELSTLKSLYLSHDEEQQINFPPNLLSRLTLLQELHVTSENNINLLELNSLSRLTALSLTVSAEQGFQENFMFPKLQRNNIVVNGYFGYLRGLTFRTLKINNLPSLLSAFKDLFCNVEKLSLENVDGEKNIIPNLCKKRVNELTSLWLKSCEDMEFLIDITGEQGSSVALSNLVEVDIRNMNCLKELCHGPPPTGFLRNLEEVSIEHCKRLQVVFQMNKISEKVESQAPLLSRLTILKLYSLPELESIWNLESSHHEIASLRSLKVVRIGDCSKLKTIFSPYLALSMLHLQELYIDCCDGLEQIISFAQEDENHYSLCWPKWKTLWIENCRSLKYVFPDTLSQALPQLECVYLKNCPHLMLIYDQTEGKDVTGNHILLNVPFLRNLSVINCPQLTCFVVQAQLEKLYLSNVTCRQLCHIDVLTLNQDYIIVGDHEEVFQVQGGHLFSSLQELHLECLSKVQIIWKDVAQVVTLQNLTTLEIIDCKKLRYIFSPTTVCSLSQLVSLQIKGCEELERIILPKDQVSSSSHGDIGLQPISFPNLATVSVTNCENLKTLFPLGFVSSPHQLKYLVVKQNPKLAQVFEVEDGREVTTKKEIKFDKLERLALEELACLVELCPKGYHFVFSALTFLIVRECPNMTTGFFIDSNHFVHSKKIEVYTLQSLMLFKPMAFIITSL
ncbi:probable disease resistance protein At4g27220 [Gossypium arboreum]|uniref:Disease resistance protein At4g27220 n=1 Tax=Gossypium arboreum TaxID=29729 RepID=A0ABR0Q4W7_GOSAR|nr:probable disease resistance protein At4g27220 [Gossypium arboreum]KAK5834369.1 hypothetical protein PVK06_018246 [Gossypium arboreum]